MIYRYSVEVLYAGCSGECEGGIVYRAQNSRQTDDGATAVRAIRSLCIKHTFVDGEERRGEEERELRKRSAG